MEKIKNNEIRETLILTNKIFCLLFDKIIEHFTRLHGIDFSYKDSQLFGYGNFDHTKPSLKNDLELLTKEYINGKYLYNKNREVAAGNPHIKISRDYKYVFFNYIGCKDIYEFLKQDFVEKRDRKEQLSLLGQENNIEDYFYVSYYYGEDKKMNKGQVIIYKQWKNVEMKYFYEDNSGKVGVYPFFGQIIRSENYLFFDTKFFVGTKKFEGAKYFFFIGKAAPHERDFLIGTYTGFDKYDNTIAGKIILRKVDSRESMEMEIAKKSINPILSFELNKNRIIVENVIKKNPLQFSPMSPYAKILNDIADTYTVKFYHQENIYSIVLEIEKNHLNIKCPDNSLIIEQDYIQLLSNGQILNLEFKVRGLFNIQKASIYIKSNFLLNNDAKKLGMYTAINLDNSIISGQVEFDLLQELTLR